MTFLNISTLYVGSSVFYRLLIEYDIFKFTPIQNIQIDT